MNATGLGWVTELVSFKFRSHYRSGAKNKDADYLLRHPIAEIEQLESENHSIIDSDTTHPPSIQHILHQLMLT